MAALASKPHMRAALTSGFRVKLAGLTTLNEKVPLAWKDRACRESCPSPAEGTFQMQNSARSSKVTVSADGRGLVSQAGAVLLWETMRVTGLARGLSAALEPWRAPRAVHDPGKIVADLAAAQRGQLAADLKTQASTRTIPADEWVLNEISAHVQRYGTGPGEVIVTNRLGKVARRNSFGDLWRGRR